MTLLEDSPGVRLLLLACGLVVCRKPHNDPAVHRPEPRRDECRISEHSKAAVGVRCNCELAAATCTPLRPTIS